MRKTIIPVALAIGMALQFAGAQTTEPAGSDTVAENASFMISRDNTVVFSQHGWGRITHCRVNKGTRVHINQSYSAGSRNVTIIEGPHYGCQGDVNRLDLIRVPNP